MKPSVKSDSSYGQIVKASSIIGVSQGANYLIGIVRVKLAAVFLGPAGVGLLGLYSSAMELVGTISGLGLSSSGVRDVAEADASEDTKRLARTAITLRRACWVTGLFGWLLCAALSYPLSIYIFESAEHALAIAILGATILITSVSGGRSALIQGTRRIGDLARLGVLGSLVGTMIAVVLYGWLGQNGIVPALISTAGINLGFSFWFARKIPLQCVLITWPETLRNSKRLIQVGMAFMYGALLASVVGLLIRSLIVRDHGLDASGIFYSAWAISGMFGGFIINAMATDFYPRLTAVANDNDEVNLLVNEQTEIGILLALPGILGTLVFAPIIMHLLYTAEFVAGAQFLPWFVIGVFVSLLIFPMGMIARAKGAVRWIYIGQTWANLSRLIIAITLMPTFGILGVAYASPLGLFLQSLFVLFVARHLSNFRWTRSVRNLIVVAMALITAAGAIRLIPNSHAAICAGAVIVIIGCLFSLRGIGTRLGPNHRIVQAVCRLPGGRLACGLD